jgi:hypothetical protein
MCFLSRARSFGWLDPSLWRIPTAASLSHHAARYLDFIPISPNY